MEVWLKRLTKQFFLKKRLDGYYCSTICPTFFKHFSFKQFCWTNSTTVVSVQLFPNISFLVCLTRLTASGARVLPGKGTRTENSELVSFQCTYHISSLLFSSLLFSSLASCFLLLASSFLALPQNIYNMMPLPLTSVPFLKQIIAWLLFVLVSMWIVRKTLCRLAREHLMNAVVMFLLYVCWRKCPSVIQDKLLHNLDLCADMAWNSLVAVLRFSCNAVFEGVDKALDTLLGHTDMFAAM